ncbi:MAG TPA: thiamine pyrophosphate-dependent enzyme [Methylomirabilota bacterium]|nr:thiamine pyrophosphate-dependent enzyme [Methylomirabilota bacterium]
MTPRKPFLDALVACLTPRDVLVSCLGANARWLPHMTVPAPVFALCDSMGAAIPLALGIALTRPERHVIALEGDGSLLMSPNVLATVAAARPANLTSILWVNRHYESSGGQALPGVAVDWPALARATGIAHVATVDTPGAMAPALAAARQAARAAFLVVPIAFDPAEEIPPYSEKPEEITARFRL